MDDITLIKKLSDCAGTSGFEDEVLLIAREYLKGIAGFEEDSMRNLYIYPKYNKGNRPLVMLDAHSDEVGFMVQAIKPDGTLRFVTMGYWNEKSLPGLKVKVYTKQGYITGVIGAQPPHLMTADQRNAPLTVSNMFIDVGATDAEEAQKCGVEVGAPAVPATLFEHDKARRLYFGKAFDDRLGVAALLKVIKNLEKAPLNVDIAGVISSQEEVGDRGIKAVMHRVKADAAICIEGCPADDTSAPAYMVQDALHGGVMLRHVDATVICTPRFNKFAVETAKKAGVKVQLAVRSGGGNNGAYIVSANGGTPVIVAGLPVRYIHSGNCIAAEDDFYSAVKLCEELCKNLDGGVIKAF